MLLIMTQSRRQEFRTVINNLKDLIPAPCLILAGTSFAELMKGAGMMRLIYRFSFKKTGSQLNICNYDFYITVYRKNSE